MGRPKKHEDDLTVNIRLERKHVNTLDNHIARQLFMNDPESGYPSQIKIANARRKYLGKLIDDNLGNWANLLTRIEVRAPGGGNSEELEQIAIYLQQVQERAEREAPEPITKALENNRELAKLRDTQKEK